MTTKVELFNIAIGRVGIGQKIDDPEERTEPARQCRRVYDFCRKKVLRNHPFSHARRAAALALLDQTYPGYTYVYDYPNSCLSLLEIIPEDGLRWQQGALLFGNWDERENWRIPRIAYERILRTDGQAQAIATDLEDAWAVFTVDVDALPVWPEDVADALAWCLAAEVGGPLKADRDLVQTAWNTYENHKLRAAGNDLNEGYPDPEPDAPSIMARW
jgi:hypothetical protein